MFKTSRLVLVKVSLFNLQGTHPRAAQGLYISTLASVCQEVFSTFFETLSRFAPSPERLINIPRTSPFVNTFFHLFSNFFKKSQTCVIIGL